MLVVNRRFEVDFIESNVYSRLFYMYLLKLAGDAKTAELSKRIVETT